MMVISQKKTCEGCKALEDAQGATMKCRLEYNNRGRYISSLGIYKINPQEACPKPKTYMDYMLADNTLRKGK